MMYSRPEQLGESVTILGGGLVGAMLSMYLVRRGFKVSVYEKRPDLRSVDLEAGRSINLALSHRGLRALSENGLLQGLDKVMVPMHGRMMHDVKGNLTFQAYGKEGQHINSVSRNGLNQELVQQADKAGVDFHFESEVQQVNLKGPSLQIKQGTTIKDLKEPGLLVGADGSFSVLRNAMQRTDRFNYSQQFIEHGYKELSIPPVNGDYAMEPNALHIWPRGRYMLIALPNKDKSFTCTLFLDYERQKNGVESFASLQDIDVVEAFFEANFADARALMPDFETQWAQNPVASLVMVRCYPWHRGHSMLIGDASHALVPFYGQGMNAGFEDCRLFNETVTRLGHKGWDAVLTDFEQNRKKDADAISTLAMNNFVEMRDHVGNPAFLLRKKIEAHLAALYPGKWIPLYSMVTFSDMPYNNALETGYKQTEIMQEIMGLPGIEDRWLDLDYTVYINRLHKNLEAAALV